MLHRNEFTAGPWAVDRVPIESRGGSNTCFKIGPMVACIYDDWRARERGISEEQQIANAHLIAASPEMYWALQQLCNSGGVMEWLEMHSPCIREAAEEALAKARGES